VIRLVGGLMYLSGMLIMVYNVAKTLMLAKPVNNKIPALTTNHAGGSVGNALHA
jgi:cytochrome c oxidase cbb3-type subunit 1